MTLHVERLQNIDVDPLSAQTIRRLLPTSCLSVLDHFVRLALKGFSDQGWQLKRLSESSLLILKI